MIDAALRYTLEVKKKIKDLNNEVGRNVGPIVGSPRIEDQAVDYAIGQFLAGIMSTDFMITEPAKDAIKQFTRSMYAVSSELADEELDK